MEETATAEIRERGEVTIPKRIREACHFEEGQRLEFIPLSKEVLLVTPHRLELEEARRMIRRILKETRGNPARVLKGLEEGREEIFSEHYGHNRHGR